MRIGIVGLGSIGRRHLGNLLDQGREVVGMDVSEDARAKAKADYPLATIVDALPFAGLDALVIATPAGNHLRWVEECIARKIPFLVEKPLGTLDQLPRWRDIAAMNLPIHGVGYNWRWNRDIGMGLMKTRAVATRFTFAYFRCYTNIATWPGGSYVDPLLECSHEIDLARWLFPASRVLDAVRGESSAWIETQNCLIDLNWSAAYQLREHILRPVPWRGRSRMSRVRSSDFAIEQSYKLEMDDFVTAVRRGRGYLGASLADGVGVLDVCAQVEAMIA